jgi:hypothetical protein
MYATGPDAKKPDQSDYHLIRPLIRRQTDLKRFSTRAIMAGTNPESAG